MRFLQKDISCFDNRIFITLINRSIVDKNTGNTIELVRQQFVINQYGVASIRNEDINSSDYATIKCRATRIKNA